MHFVRFIAFLTIAFCLVSCSGDPKKRAQKYLESGNRYYDHANYKAARIMYINAYRSDPKFGEAYYHLALVEMKMQRVINAIAPLRRAIELLPKDGNDYIDANVKFAEIMLLAAQAPDAVDRNAKVIEEVRGIKDMLLAKNPNSFEGTKLLGELTVNDAIALARKNKGQEAKDKLGEAIAIYRKALAQKPGDSVTMLALAKGLGMYGEVDEAEQLYRQVLDKDKTLMGPYNELYKLYITKRKLPEAESILKGAIATHQSDYNLQVLLAAHYFSVNNRTEMTKVLNNLKSHFKEFPEAFMKAGDFYFRIGDADQAIRQYQEGISADASHRLDYQKRVIEVLIRQGKTAQAYEKDLEILKENPKDPEARGLKASFLLDKGDVDAAISELQSVVTAKPDHFVARFNLGRAYFAKNELEQARQQFDSALKQRTDYMPARLALTQLALRRGDADAALKMAQDTLKMNPGSGVAILLEAAAYLRKGQYDESRALLDKILQGNPNQADTLLELAVLDLYQKKYKEAEEPFRKAYAVDPTNLRGLLGLAEIHFQQKEPAKAVQLLADEALKQPQRPDLKKELGNAEFRAQMYDKAISDYQSILDRYKDSPNDQGELYARIGVTYSTKGDVQKGLENLQKARQLVPTSVAYISQIAQYYDILGNRQEALKAYREAMKLEPNNPVVLNNLAYLMTSTNGNLDEALTLAQRAKQQLSNFPEVSDTIGWIYIKKNLSDSAIEIFRDLNAKVTNNPTFRYHYGMALAQKGDKANALIQLKTAMQIIQVKAAVPNTPKNDEEDQIKELIQKLS
jgi:tetratricopeptide (TPR) repeat protein